MPQSDGWRLVCSNQSTATSSYKRGTRFGYYVNAGGHSVAGMYFGTSDKAEAESHPDKYIFLPYTGRANLNWDGTEKSLHPMWVELLII
ncbi:hypothetical protein SFC43_13910 [Bacteroides sp. CR5/BHMF/2]|nr:hypothetical protein [Bacteroides sp. CR5/BHMF/2]